MMGVAPAAFGDLVQAFDPAPIANGANCGVGAREPAVADNVRIAAIFRVSAMARPQGTQKNNTRPARCTR